VRVLPCLLPLPPAHFPPFTAVPPGGTHHAYADAGSGFCILNDLAYTAAVVLQQGLVERVLILDLDVHQVSRGGGEAGRGRDTGRKRACRCGSGCCCAGGEEADSRQASGCLVKTD